MTENPAIDPRMAADLDQISRARALQRQVEQNRAAEAALQRVAAWDRAMQRAFKGIMPRPVRHAFLQRAAKRQEAERAS